MLKEVKMFTLICDNCGKDANEDADYACWNASGFAEQCAMESGWIKDSDKHYCSECFTYDDNDNLILRVVKNKKP